MQTGNFEIQLIYRCDELFLSVSALGPSGAVERLSGLRVARESPKSRSREREPAEQLRRVYYLFLPHEPNIGEQVVVEPG